MTCIIFKEKSVVILIFSPPIGEMSFCSDWFYFLVFSNLIMCGFLCVYPTWGLLSLLNLRIDFFFTFDNFEPNIF